MSKDYYAVLGLTRSVDDASIKKAYRTLSLKYHPQKNVGAGGEAKFKELAEAYEVLSNAKWRALYNRFGEEGLKAGVPTLDEEGFSGAYTFHGDAEKVFRDFFGGDNPFTEIFDLGTTGDMRGLPEFSGLFGRGRPKKFPPRVDELSCTLEEIFRGATKILKITRQVLNEDARTTSARQKLLTVHVEPGWKEGTEIRFIKEGDQGPNAIPGDVILVIRDRPHKRFQRQGIDLLYTANISLMEALTGSLIEIETLDNRFLKVQLTDIVVPGYTKRVKGEGMPDLDNPGKRGDLLISFNIDFPKKLTPQQKQALREILKS